MENQEEIQDMLDNYLLGKMDEKEKIEFLTKAENDPELLRELQISMAVHKGILYSGTQDLKERLRKIETEIDMDRKNNRTPRIISMQRFVSVAAILLVVCVPAYFLFFNHHTGSTDLYSQYYAPYEANGISRGSNDRTESAIYEKYDDKQYASALQDFSQLAADSVSTQLMLIKGICELEINESGEAISEFDQIINSGDQIYSDQALWYAAMTSLKENKNDQAKQYLQKLVSDSSADHYTEAKELLDKL